MNQFGEPWKLEEFIGDGGGHGKDIIDSDRDPIAHILAHGERIVACVNLLEGVPTETIHRITADPQALAYFRWMMENA